MSLALRLRPELAQAGFDRLWEVCEAGRMTLVVGNSKALWPVFAPILRGARVGSPQRAGDHRAASAQDDDDPLDRYTEQTIARIVGPHRVREVLYAHDDPPPPIQRIAALANDLWVAPCGMVIDAQFGLWVALRAVIRTDEPAQPVGPAPASPCDGCDAPCRGALHAALGASPTTLEGVRTHWRQWLAIREVCPVAPEQRYGEEQIGYHYRGERCSKK